MAWRVFEVKVWNAPILSTSLVLVLCQGLHSMHHLLSSSYIKDMAQSIKPTVTQTLRDTSCELLFALLHITEHEKHTWGVRCDIML